MPSRSEVTGASPWARLPYPRPPCALPSPSPVRGASQRAGRKLRLIDNTQTGRLGSSSATNPCAKSSDPAVRRRICPANFRPRPTRRHTPYPRAGRQRPTTRAQSRPALPGKPCNTKAGTNGLSANIFSCQSPLASRAHSGANNPSSIIASGTRKTTVSTTPRQGILARNSGNVIPCRKKANAAVGKQNLIKCLPHSPFSWYNEKNAKSRSHAMFFRKVHLGYRRD